MYPRKPRFFGATSHLCLFGICLLFALLLVGCGTPKGSGLDSNITTPITSNADSTTPTETPADAPTTESGKTPTPTATATATPVLFAVSGVTATPNASTYTGTCSATRTITITGTIYAPAHNTGGQVTYDWVRSDNTASAHHTIIFGAGTTAIAVQSIWTMSADKGTGTKYWVSLKTLSPQIFTSAHATFSFKCKRAVKSVSATVTSTSTCIGGKSFSAVITITPGPGSVSVTYTWKRSDSATASAVTVIIPQDQATTTVTTTWTLPVVGSHWEEVATSSPNSITSNKATFTC